MPRATRPRMLTATLVAGLCCSFGAAGWGMYQDQAHAGQAAAGAAAVAVAQPAAPARPALTGQQAWDLVRPQVEQSPWLSRADETAATIDQLGKDAREATDAVSAQLRELNVLMNESRTGRMTVATLKQVVNGSAVFAPGPGVRLVAEGIIYTLDHADEWALAMADRADDLSRWVESITEPYARYAQAYAAVTEQATAERVGAWIDAAQALLPHLAQAEKVCAALQSQLESVSGCLHAVHDALAGADHWSVDWLADSVDGKLIQPSMEKLDRLGMQVGAMKAMAMYDQALIASLPGRFARYEIMD